MSVLDCGTCSAPVLLSAISDMLENKVNSHKDKDLRRRHLFKSKKRKKILDFHTIL